VNDLEVDAFRAGFEDLIKVCQKKLLEWLDKLVEENRPLRKDERSDFLELVARSMLGQGTKILLGKTIFGEAKPEKWGGSNSELSQEVMLYNAEDYLRFLAYWTSDKMGIMDTDTGKRTGDQPISENWKVARQLALRTFSLAIDKVLSVSPERTTWGSMEARPT
jgi:hypothetical protein